MNIPRIDESPWQPAKLRRQVAAHNKAVEAFEAMPAERERLRQAAAEWLFDGKGGGGVAFLEARNRVVAHEVDTLKAEVAIRRRLAGIIDNAEAASACRTAELFAGITAAEAAVTAALADAGFTSPSIAHVRSHRDWIAAAKAHQAQVTAGQAVTGQRRGNNDATEAAIRCLGRIAERHGLRGQIAKPEGALEGNTDETI